MKKVMIALTVIGILSLMNVPGVMAAMKKPPKSACYSLTNPSSLGNFHGGTLIINTKFSGMKTKSVWGNTKFYNIQGAIGPESGSVDFPITGGGYWDIPWGEFEGTMSGDTGIFRTECVIEIADEYRYLSCTYGSNPDPVYYSLERIDCETVLIW